ncbi:MAG: MarR family winged helix-turn-helix transcriptional regulator [Candidatus Saccharimonadales bacterium]
MRETEPAEFTRLVKRQYLLINHNIDALLRGAGIARSQFQVLFYIKKSGQLAQSQLIAIMKIEPATVCAITGALEQKGWISRQTSSSDRRVKSLTLTTEGEQILYAIPNPAEAISKTMLKGFNKADKTKFEQFINQAITNLESKKGE